MTYPLMDIDELARFLRISKRLAEDVVMQTGFPRFDLSSRTHRYDREEVMVWLRAERERKQKVVKEFSDVTAGLHPVNRYAA